MTTNISNFEREKPKETMAAINKLEKYLENALQEKRDETNPYQVIVEAWRQIQDIRGKFKRGE